jgi:hypothetical protein
MFCATDLPAAYRDGLTGPLTDEIAERGSPV